MAKAIATQLVIGIDVIASSGVARRVPGSYAGRFLSNHAVPWIAQSVFRPGVHEVNRVRMEIPPLGEGRGGEHHMALGTYERHDLRLVLDVLRPGDGFVDVGAHIGYFSLPAARRVGPGGRVLAVEPTPASAAVLRANARLNDFDWIRVVEAAASDRSGHAALVTSRESPMWNSLEVDALPDDEVRTTVATVTIDDLLDELGWPPIRLMKIDVEGHELSVLRGAASALERYRDVVIMFEVSGGSSERTRVSMNTLDHLAAADFVFRSTKQGLARPTLSKEYLETRMSMPRWQDSLFNVVATRRS